MKPSELDEEFFLKLGRQCGNTNKVLAIINEILRQKLLGIDEDIEDNIGVTVKEIKVGD